MRNHNDCIISDHIRMPNSHSMLAQITINVIDYHNFCRMAEQTFDTNIIGHDEPKDGRMTVFVACSSTATVDRLMYAWH